MKHFTLFVSCLLIAITTQSSASTMPNPWTLAFELGVEDDSNVVVTDTDENSNRSSLSRRSKFSLGYKHKSEDKKSDSSISYSYFRQDFEDLSTFDSELSLLNVKTNYKLNNVKLGISGQLVDANLGGEDLLKINQVSPNISYFISKTNYLYAQATFGKKTFADAPERDANQMTLSANYYQLFNGLNHYISFGAKYKNEDAEFDLHSYDLFELKTQYVYRTKLLSYPARFNLSYRYQNRQYDDELHPSIDEYRHDKRHQLKASMRLDWTERWYNELTLTRQFNHSNVSFADFDRTKLGLLLGLSL